ncbi:helix-turn-helix domain-containing protein [Pseudonocardia asaccharolytica]|uniref:Transcriptional regulator n=1 Tax=Pseudonocardia asaccharolytica DSM 44247 = NBRC 16224 TaxID=1123024 RepID=A0A511CWB2_9PSEU|nr:helix-turn-helix transcriptional regulator [Pseudonocardia asaccharolytica]GEL16859.1 transcriptional regulator [Pseudonocardia asaccharolytica DSM 44247 = NBRC 16224]
MTAVLTAPAPGSGFGALLRTWRQRRRITQLDLGIQADVSARHLSFLETGRSRPSREMVLHLAEELDVPLRGRNELLVAAGFAPAYTEHGLADAELGEVRGSLDRILDGHEPYPAVVVDGRWNLVAGNRAVALLTDLVDPRLLAPPLNVLRVSLHPDGLAPHVTDLAEYAAHLVSRLRRQVARAADPALAELLAELTGYLRDAGLDPAAQPRDRIVLPLRLCHPDQELTLFSTVAVLGAPLDVTLEEIAIESFFPADDATARYLRTRFG